MKNSNCLPTKIPPNQVLIKPDQSTYPGSSGEGPRLFGISHSNRDFSQPEAWGKNNFNSSFPASLACWMFHRGLEANYLTTNPDGFSKQWIGFEKVFGMAPDDPNISFEFETQFLEYSQYNIGTVPRTDLTIADRRDPNTQTACLEVKLTAIPDSTTKDLREENFSSEIVLRPDTVFYLAAGLAHRNPRQLESLLDDPVNIHDWTSQDAVLRKYDEIVDRLIGLSTRNDIEEHPVLLQPIWKTQGDIVALAEQCLDIFVWSSTGLLYFIAQISKTNTSRGISRPRRSIVWLYRMLEDIAIDGRTDFGDTVDRYSFGTKNDKAMAAGGLATYPYLQCESLSRPRISKGEIHDMILGGGQNLLRPERRFDAVIVGSPSLFEDHEDS